MLVTLPHERGNDDGPDGALAAARAEAIKNNYKIVSGIVGNIVVAEYAELVNKFNHERWANTDLCLCHDEKFEW